MVFVRSPHKLKAKPDSVSWWWKIYISQYISSQNIFFFGCLEPSRDRVFFQKKLLWTLVSFKMSKSDYLVPGYLADFGLPWWSNKGILTAVSATYFSRGPNLMKNHFNRCLRKSDIDSLKLQSVQSKAFLQKDLGSTWLWLKTLFGFKKCDCFGPEYMSKFGLLWW